MTLTFDEAYEKLDSIVESTLLDLEIASLQESAEDEDYYDDEFIDESADEEYYDESLDESVWVKRSSGEVTSTEPADKKGWKEYADSTAYLAAKKKADERKQARAAKKDAPTQADKDYVVKNTDTSTFKPENPQTGVNWTTPENKKDDSKLTDAAKAALAKNGTPPTDYNIMMMKKQLLAKSRKDGRAQKLEKDPADSKIKAIAKTVARGLVAVFRALKKAFTVIREFFAKLGGKSFKTNRPTIKALVDYSCISKICSYVDKALRSGGLNQKYAGDVSNELAAANNNAAGDKEFTSYEQDCFKAVPAGTLVNPTTVAKIAAFAANASAKYEALAASMETAVAEEKQKEAEGKPVNNKHAVGKVQVMATMLRKVSGFLRDLESKANELMSYMKHANKSGIDLNTKFAKGAEAGSSMADKAYARTAKASKLSAAHNESVSILLAQANELLSEGATDEAMTLMATASSLMEGAEEYTDGVGTDFGAPDDIDQFDSEVSDDEYPAEDVTGGEGQDPDADIKEVLGGDTVALKLMTDDEGNELVDESAEEIEIIL